jgi:predicted nuclease with TOPRIM domain
MVHSRILARALIFLVCAGSTLSLTGCQEQEKLAAKTKEVRQKIEELEALKESSPAAQTKKHPLAQKPKVLQAAITTLESDVAQLQERKTTLEADLVTLEKEGAAYRIKNL